MSIETSRMSGLSPKGSPKLHIWNCHKEQYEGRPENYEEKRGKFSLFNQPLFSKNIEPSTLASWMRIRLLTVNWRTTGTEGPQWLETEVI